MSRFNLSESEIKLIKKVLGWSIIISVFLIGTAWIYFRLQLSRKTVKKPAAEILIESNDIIPIDIEAHRAIAARYLQIG